MADQWYYAKGKQRKGPVSTDQLKELASSGQLLPTDMVWKKGMQKWAEADSVEGLFPQAAPPPLPPSSPEPARSLPSAPPVGSSISTPWPAEEKTAPNWLLLGSWAGAGVSGVFAVVVLFASDGEGFPFSLVLLAIGGALLFYRFGHRNYLFGRWHPADGSAHWIELLKSGVYRADDGTVGTFTLSRNERFIDIIVGGRLIDSWKLLSREEGVFSKGLEIQDSKGHVRTFKKGKTLQEKQASFFYTDRVEYLHATWIPLDGSDAWIQFTKDGGMVSADGSAGRFTFSGEEPNEVITVQLTNNSSKQLRVVSLTTDQLVLGEGQQAKVYRRLTPAKKEAKSSAASGSSGSKSESAALEPVAESEGESDSSQHAAGTAKGKGFFGTLFSFFSKKKKCPKCQEKSAEETGRRLLDSGQQWGSATRFDPDGQVRVRQVVYNVYLYRVSFHCKSCGHKWNEEQQCQRVA